MNSISLTGMTLIVLGLAGVFSTAAATAAIPALFGLVLLALGLRARNPLRTRSSATAAAVVAALGVLAPLGNLLPRLAGGELRVNAAVFANVSMLLVCAFYLALWLWERRQGMDGAR
jgi:hypothetical protein